MAWLGGVVRGLLDDCHSWSQWSSAQQNLPPDPVRKAPSFFTAVPHGLWGGFASGSVVKNTPATQETRVQSLHQDDPLE